MKRREEKREEKERREGEEIREEKRKEYARNLSPSVFQGSVSDATSPFATFTFISSTTTGKKVRGR